MLSGAKAPPAQGVGEEQFDVAVRIEAERSHEGAVGDRRSAKRGGQTRDTVADFRPGAPAVTGNGCRAFGLAGDGLAQEAGSLHVFIGFGRLRRWFAP